MLRLTKLESSFSEKDLGLLVNTKSNMSQHCALVEKGANSLLRCIRKCCQQVEGVDPSVYSALLKLYLECWLQFRAPS